MDNDGDAVLQANAAFYAAFASRDLAAMADVWADDNGVSCIHPGWNVLRGRVAVLESWESILANPAQPRVVAGGAQATVMGEGAVVVCRELVGGNPLAATNVFRREGDAWKLVHHHAGPVAQPLE